MAAIKSEVAMGRRMKIRETFIAVLSWTRSSLALTYGDLRSLLEFIDSLCDDDLARIESLID
jgi:hypothetical protein